MRRRRLVVAAILLGVLVLLLAAGEAWGAAGGGSSGFGGGGGGGRGAGLYVLIQILIRIAIFGHGLGLLIILSVILLVVFFGVVAPRARNFQAARREAGSAARRQVASRERSVELAAAEASDEDPAFAPDAVRVRAASLFAEVQDAWDRGDVGRLAKLVAPELLAEWQRRLEGLRRRGWRNRVAVLGDPQIAYVGLHRGRAPGEDRVTVRVQARLRDFVEDQAGNRIHRIGRIGETVEIREFWTLRKDARGVWILGSIEQGAEGAHALQEKVVPAPWTDEAALRDEALVEQAAAQTVPEGMRVAEVAPVDFDGDARAAALDLSLVDARFSPDVLEVAVRRAVQAWAEAVDGDRSGLAALAAPAAVRGLLQGGLADAGTRVVLRGATPRRVRIAELRAAADPPRMAVEVEIEAVRYVEDRQTAAVLEGSRDRRTRFTTRWILELTADGRQPWRIAEVQAPARARL